MMTLPVGINIQSGSVKERTLTSTDSDSIEDNPPYRNKDHPPL